MERHTKIQNNFLKFDDWPISSPNLVRFGLLNSEKSAGRSLLKWVYWDKFVYVHINAEADLDMGDRSPCLGSRTLRKADDSAPNKFGQ